MPVEHICPWGPLVCTFKTFQFFHSFISYFLVNLLLFVWFSVYKGVNSIVEDVSVIHCSIYSVYCDCFVMPTYRQGWFYRPALLTLSSLFSVKIHNSMMICWILLKLATTNDTGNMDSTHELSLSYLCICVFKKIQHIIIELWLLRCF